MGLGFGPHEIHGLACDLGMVLGEGLFSDRSVGVEAGRSGLVLINVALNLAGRWEDPSTMKSVLLECFHVLWLLPIVRKEDVGILYVSEGL